MRLPVPQRHLLSRSGAVPCSHWLLAAGLAALLHLTVLIIVLCLPSRPLVEDPAQPNQAVTIVVEPPPTEAPPSEAEQPPSASEPQTEAAPPHPEPATVAMPDIPPPPPPARPLVPKPAPVRPRRIERPPIVRPAAPEVAAEPSLPVVTVAPPSGDVLGPYRNALATHLQTYRRYPLLARIRHEQGTVRVRVLVRRNGQIDSLAIDQGSGSDRLDREALATLRRAEPLPPIPASVAGETMELVFPLSFRLE